MLPSIHAAFLVRRMLPCSSQVGDEPFAEPAASADRSAVTIAGFPGLPHAAAYRLKLSVSTTFRRLTSVSTTIPSVPSVNFWGRPLFTRDLKQIGMGIHV
jgi:hypothetical protein